MQGHSSKDIALIRELPEGTGGRSLLLAGKGKPFYAGLKRSSADTLLEAALTLLADPCYQEILVFSGVNGSGVNGTEPHLPSLPLDRELTVGKSYALWNYRGGAAPAASRAQRSPTGTIPLEALAAKRHPFKLLQDTVWDERIAEICSAVEDRTGYRWLNSGRHDNIRRTTAPMRGLILIDDAFLTAYNSKIFNPFSEARGVPSDAQKNTWGSRFEELPGLCVGTGWDMVIFCRSMRLGMALQAGTFTLDELESRAVGERQAEEVKGVAGEFPRLQWPGIKLATLPAVNAEHPNGVFFPGAKANLYQTLRAVAPKIPMSPLEELRQKMVGMESVLAQLTPLEAYAKELQGVEKQGGTLGEVRLNTLIYGSPGVGKTTLARIIGSIYSNLGLLRGDKFTKVTRGDLVGRYIGETAQKTREVCEKSMGGTLFIDEAHKLAQGGEHDFGSEAAGELLGPMLNFPRDLVVIAAGYENRMRSFLQLDDGLRGRFEWTIRLPDYSMEELVKIIYHDAARRQLRIEDGAHEVIMRKLEERRKECQAANLEFAHARDAIELFDKALIQATYRRSKSKAACPRDVLLVEDFEHAMLSTMPPVQ